MIDRILLTAMAAAAIALAQAPKADDALLPPLEREQKQIIDDTIAKAHNYDKLLPDFVCTQMSHHNIDPKGTNQWKTLETVSEELRFVNGAPVYTTIAENGKKAESGKRPPNVVSITEFSKAIHDIFDPAMDAKFAWTKWESVRGHRTHVLTFIVPKEHSVFEVPKPKPFVSGLAGFVWVDADTNLIVRIVVGASDIPKKNSMQGVSMDLGYEFTRVGDKVYLLPLQGDFREREGKTQTWNEVEFKDYKKP